MIVKRRLDREKLTVSLGELSLEWLAANWMTFIRRCSKKAQSSAIKIRAMRAATMR